MLRYRRSTLESNRLIAVVLVALGSSLALLSCATDKGAAESSGAPSRSETSGEPSSDPEASKEPSLVEFMRSRQYVQRKLGLQGLRADVVVEVDRPSSEGTDDAYQLEFSWRAPDELQITPVAGTSSPKRARQYAEKLRGIANLIVKRKMPASHRAETTRREGDRIVAERDKGSGRVRVVADEDGRILKMHHLVPTSNGEGLRRKTTFDVSTRKVDGQYLADGMVLYVYERSNGERKKVRVLRVEATLTDVSVGNRTVKIGEKLRVESRGGTVTTYQLENIRPNPDSGAASAE